MSNPLIISFQDRLATDHALVGGKGGNLGRMAQAGFNVPPGFSVTTAAYAKFLNAAGLTATIEKLLAGVDYDNPQKLEVVAASIRTAIESETLPVSLTQTISHAYNALSETASSGGEYVAVRSSGTAEDLAGASFAGLHDTYLDIQGTDMVVDAIKRCWASLWATRAVSYRHTRGFNHFDSPIAIVVQKMVCSEVSGVMFTGNPLSGATDELLINASWGLGEAVVQGIATPDEFAVQHGDLRILERKLGSKQVQIIRNPETEQGNVTVDVPAAQQTVYCLPDAIVQQLADLGRQVQAYYDGLPQDTEWALAQGQLYLLQARPVTGVEFCWDSDVTFSIDGPPMKGDEIFTRSLADEVWGGGTTPLWFSYRTIGWNSAHDHMTTIWGYPEYTSPVTRVFSYYQGIPYYNLQMDRGLLEDQCPPQFRDFGFNRMPTRWHQDIANAPFDYWRFIKMYARVEILTPTEGLRWAKHMQQDWIDNHQRCKEFKGVNNTELQNMDDSTLQNYIKKMAHADGEWFHQCGSGLYAYFREVMGLLRLIIKHWYNGDNDGLYTDVLMGGPYRSATQIENRALWDLSQQVRHIPALLDIFMKQPAEKIFPAITNLSDAQEFLRSYEQFIELHGHRGHSDRDVYFTRRAEDPAVTCRSIMAMLSIDENDTPDIRDTATDKKRNAAIAEAVNNIGQKPMGWLKVQAFKKVLDFAHLSIAYRDNERQFTDRSTYAVKRAMLELNRRSMANNLFKDEQDFYFLTLAEWLDLFNQRSSAILCEAKITARKKNFYEVEGKTVQRPMYIQRGLPLVIDKERASEDDSKGIFCGTSTSRGKTVGRARVIRSLTEIGDVEAGDILITRSTDPGWTPVFLVIKGIVLETGGALAHGALLAREYGFPAVQIDNAMNRIPDGARLSIDGDTGVVTILPDDDSGEPTSLPVNDNKDTQAA